MAFATGEQWAISGGNKWGRPKHSRNIAEYCRKKTKDGREIVNYYYDVFRDKAIPHETRIKAAQRIEERGWGKAPADPLIDRSMVPIRIIVANQIVTTHEQAQEPELRTAIGVSLALPAQSNTDSPDSTDEESTT